MRNHNSNCWCGPDVASIRLQDSSCYQAETASCTLDDTRRLLMLSWCILYTPAGQQLLPGSNSFMHTRWHTNIFFSAISSDQEQTSDSRTIGSFPLFNQTLKKIVIHQLSASVQPSSVEQRERLCVQLWKHSTVWAIVVLLSFSTKWAKGCWPVEQVLSPSHCIGSSCRFTVSKNAFKEPLRNAMSS